MADYPEYFQWVDLSVGHPKAKNQMGPAGEYFNKEELRALDTESERYIFVPPSKQGQILEVKAALAALARLALLP